MARTIACVVARTVSTRLPLKVLRDVIPNVTMIEFLIQRLQTIKRIDDIYLCTSDEPVDTILEDIAKRNGIKIYRGSADQVTERLIAVSEIEDAENIIRITGDNPFTSVEYLENQLDFLEDNSLDYVRLVNVPIGSTAEVIRGNALKRCHEEMDPRVSEYLMLFLFEPRKYRCGTVVVSKDDNSHFSVTVDTKEDLERTKLILEHLKGYDFRKIQLSDIISLYRDETISIPYKSFSSNGPIKMPFGKVISMEEFTKDMDRRKKESKTLILNE